MDCDIRLDPLAHPSFLLYPPNPGCLSIWRFSLLTSFFLACNCDRGQSISNQLWITAFSCWVSVSTLFSISANRSPWQTPSAYLNHLSGETPTKMKQKLRPSATWGNHLLACFLINSPAAGSVLCSAFTLHIPNVILEYTQWHPAITAKSWVKGI